ncbi:hypothetical protein IG193_08630 [Infirmifilum lucidum]|uniref:Uncharacterized protein n=1 Tax=Infirmifilum lucidum TaxID=2776706 RepID=A0A7L9FG53_9CREN|nr:hypothetical protein [Infirmifilum lucidum]QOJ78798.1 hypothetical protein IG193_08630 [Infirmifilum lucidum]
MKTVVERVLKGDGRYVVVVTSDVEVAEAIRRALEQEMVAGLARGDKFVVLPEVADGTVIPHRDGIWTDGDRYYLGVSGAPGLISLPAVDGVPAPDALEERGAAPKVFTIFRMPAIDVEKTKGLLDRLKRGFARLTNGRGVVAGVALVVPEEVKEAVAGIFRGRHDVELFVV